MGRITLHVNLYEVDTQTEVEDVRETIQDLIETEFPEWETEVEIHSHRGVKCEECGKDGNH